MNSFSDYREGSATAEYRAMVDKAAAVAEHQKARVDPMYHVSHVGIYVGDNKMLHCGDPIQYADITSSYWTQHFYAFGRLS